MLLSTLQDEEIIANSAKIMRIVMKDENNMERVVQGHPDLGNVLLQTVIFAKFSDVVKMELISACRNFTRTIRGASQISSKNAQ